MCSFYELCTNLYLYVIFYLNEFYDFNLIFIVYLIRFFII